MELTVKHESSQIKTTLDSYLNAKYSYMQIEYHITRFAQKLIIHAFIYVLWNNPKQYQMQKLF